MIACAAKFALSTSPVIQYLKPSLPWTCGYISASYWYQIHLSSPPGSAFAWYCYYDTLKAFFAAHCYLPSIKKSETAYDEDDVDDYDNNKVGYGGRSSAGRWRSAKVEDMRRAALVIGCGDSDLNARIASG